MEFNATEISEKTGISKSKILSYIKDGTLPVCNEKEVYSYRLKNHLTVRYVSEDDLNKFMQGEVYKTYVAKKTKREINAKKRMETLLIKQEERKLKREIEIKNYIEDKGGLTEKLLGEVAYSFSKRAKNDFDVDNKRELYMKKDLILKRYNPVEIHLNKRSISYIDYPEDEYVDYLDKEFYRVNKEVIDVLEYFEIGTHTFHRPIDRVDNINEINKINNKLPIKEIELNNKLIDNDTLLPLDICEYVIQLLNKCE